MQILLIYICALVALSTASFEESWREFKVRHGKTYRNLKEEKLRFEIFQSNLKDIDEHNARYKKGEESWYKKVTRFADLTQEEIKQWLQQNIEHKPDLNDIEMYKPAAGEVIPDSIDWRTKGAVLAVQDQGKCFACWAFSSTGGVEGQNAIHNNQSVLLSVQNLVDCSDENNGCWGGLLPWAMDYIIDYGLESSEAYPYVAVDQQCAYDSSKVVVKISSYKSVEPNEDALLAAVGTIGPISAGVDYSYLASYGGGIYNDSRCSTTYLNHGIVVVGYGEEENVPYFIVKNSFGTDWGEDGFFRIIRGTGNERGGCGIATQALYPIL